MLGRGNTGIRDEMGECSVCKRSRKGLFPRESSESGGGRHSWVAAGEIGKG